MTLCSLVPITPDVSWKSSIRYRAAVRLPMRASRDARPRIIWSGPSTRGGRTRPERTRPSPMKAPMRFSKTCCTGSGTSVVALAVVWTCVCEWGAWSRPSDCHRYRMATQRAAATAPTAPLMMSHAAKGPMPHLSTAHHAAKPIITPAPTPARTFLIAPMVSIL